MTAGRSLTRRQALALFAAGAVSLSLGGCVVLGKVVELGHPIQDYGVWDQLPHEGELTDAERQVLEHMYVKREILDAAIAGDEPQVRLMIAYAAYIPGLFRDKWGALVWPVDYKISRDDGPLTRPTQCTYWVVNDDVFSDIPANKVVPNDRLDGFFSDDTYGRLHRDEVIDRAMAIVNEVYKDIEKDKISVTTGFVFRGERARGLSRELHSQLHGDALDLHGAGRIYYQAGVHRPLQRAHGKGGRFGSHCHREEVLFTGGRGRFLECQLG